MSGNVDAATSTREGAQISGTPGPKTATASTAKPKEGGNKAPGLRPHEGPPDYEKHRYGYPLTPGRMFGSGN